MKDDEHPKEDFNNTKLIILSGPSGSGKSCATRRLRDKHGIVPLMFYTTRGRREDDKGLYRYISLDEYEKLFNDEKFVFAFGSHENRYGILYDEFNENVFKGNDMSLATSYNNYLNRFDDKINDIVDTYLILLTFHNIEKSVRDRILFRNPNISYSDLDMKIRYAIYENQKYYDLIKPYADKIIYTDETTKDETASIIYDSIYNNNHGPVLKKRK